MSQSSPRQNLENKFEETVNKNNGVPIGNKNGKDISPSMEPSVVLGNSDDNSAML